MIKATVEHVIMNQITYLDDKECFDNKKIIVFGQNQYTVFICNYVGELGHRIECVFDNDRAKAGKFWDYTTIAPKFIADSVVLIASRYYKEMKNQLLELNYKDSDIYQLVDFRIHGSLTGQRDNAYKELLLGKSIFERIISNKEYDEVLLFPSSSIGDAYLPARHINNTFSREKILSVVVTGSIVKVLQQFVECDFEIIEKREMLALERYYWAHYEQLPNIEYMHTTPSTIKQIRVGYELISGTGYAFAEAFGRIILKNDKWDKPESLVFNCSSEKVNKYFTENNLIIGKTVFIAPFANTIGELPSWYWKHIVNTCKNVGFTVCTNLGSPEDKPVEGTIGVFCGINEIQEVINKAGFAIMMRSGVCDIAGVCKNAKKLVLYKEEFYSFCSAFSYNDLSKGKVDADAEQIVINENNYDAKLQLIDGIVKGWSSK